MSSKNNGGEPIRQKGHEIVVDLCELREIVTEAVEARFDAFREDAAFAQAPLREGESPAGLNAGEHAPQVISVSLWKALAGAAAAGMLASWLYRRR